MEFDVHPFQRLLHVQLVRGGHCDVVGAQPLIILQTSDVFFGNKTAAQQAVGVQGGLPLAVLHVGFAARQVFDMPSVDHHDLQPRLFQHRIQAQPIHAGGLHRHRTHTPLQQVVAQGLQLCRGRAEYFGRIAGDGDMHLFTADIHCGSLGIKNGQSRHKH